MHAQMDIDDRDELVVQVHDYAAGQFGFDHPATTSVWVRIGPQKRSAIKILLPKAIELREVLTAAITQHTTDRSHHDHEDGAS